MNSIEELKARIVAILDVTEFLDILGYDLSDLVEVLEEQIEENKQEFERACR
jgi:hypothetical protein